jgi:hypothetical protein
VRQPDLYPGFDGPEYVPERDWQRLTTQLGRVWSCMRDGQWRTLKEIAENTGDPEASISAQLRHLRKPRFGSHTVDRKHVRGGLFKYRLLPKASVPERKPPKHPWRRYGGC